MERKIAKIVTLVEERGYKTREKQTILEDLKNEKASKYSNEIIILDTNEFKIIGNLITNKLVLKTTNSNQIIDKEWFKKLGDLYFIMDVINGPEFS